jgi:hypothetical protein
MELSKPTTPAALKAIARTCFVSLCNAPRDLTLGRSFLAPNFSITHDSNPPSTDPDEFIRNWEKLQGIMPNFHWDIIDMVAEVNETGAGGKVWVYAKVTGRIDCLEVDTVDMMTINEEGKVVESRDVQRVTKAADKDV